MKALFAFILAWCCLGSYILADHAYVVVPYPPTQAQLDASIETLATIRVSDDGSLCILKWTGNTPEAFFGETNYNSNSVQGVLGDNWDGE